MAPSTTMDAGRVTALRLKLQRKLELLGYGAVYAVVELSWKQSAAVVMWLEDRVIRYDPIEQRLALREASSPNAWLEALDTYLLRVGCPIGVTVDANNCEWSDPIHEPQSLLRVLLWLAARAITLEFEEHAEKIKNDLRAGQASTNDEQPAQSTLDTTESPSELIRAVEKLLSVAGIDWDVAQGLQPAQLASLRKILGSNPSHENFVSSGVSQRVELTRAIERVRLFYIHDLKSLQLESNRIIAKAQEFTANPKTDTTLGNTGF